MRKVWCLAKTAYGYSEEQAVCGVETEALAFLLFRENPGRRTSYGGLLGVLYSAARKHAPQHTI